MKKMHILYEDKQLLVIDKPAHLLTVGTDKDKFHTLYHEASLYVKKQFPRNKVFIVNRLDKDTSGIVVFAKNEELKKKLQDNWDNVAITREYVAIVEGKLTNSKGKIINYLKENKQYHVYETSKNDKDAKEAITLYKVKDYKNTYSLLDIEIKTGRKNQIRVALDSIGNPITGDKKYGARKNPIGRLGLHASLLELRVPYKKETLVIKCDVPKEFNRMFESRDNNGKTTKDNC